MAVRTDATYSEQGGQTVKGAVVKVAVVCKPKGGCFSTSGPTLGGVCVWGLCRISALSVYLEQAHTSSPPQERLPSTFAYSERLCNLPSPLPLPLLLLEQGHFFPDASPATSLGNPLLF